MTTHNTHSPQSPLSNDDIIAAARQLRQEQNDRMHIRPWKRQSRWGWYIAIGCEQQKMMRKRKIMKKP